MGFPNTSNKNFAAKDNSSLPPLAENGQAYVVGSPRGGVSMQLATITPAGASYAVVFADEGLEDMADANYRVFYGGEQATTVPHTDVSTKATTGFTIINATAAELVEFVVIGRVKDTRADGRDL